MIFTDIHFFKKNYRIIYLGAYSAVSLLVKPYFVINQFLIKKGCAHSMANQSTLILINFTSHYDEVLPKK